jgi:hypothetical protein
VYKVEEVQIIVSALLFSGFAIPLKKDLSPSKPPSKCKKTGLKLLIFTVVEKELAWVLLLQRIKLLKVL